MYLDIFWSSRRLKQQFFMPLMLLPFMPAALFFFSPADLVPFIPMFLIIVCLCTLACYFSISNYLSAKLDDTALGGDFVDFNEAYIEKQIKAKHWRILTLPVSKKQSFTLIFLFFTLFILSSIFIS